MYKVLNSACAIYCSSSCCQLFGNTWNGDGLVLTDKFFSGGNYEEELRSKIYDFSSQYELNGESSFNVKEMEVFEIKFI